MKIKKDILTILVISLIFTIGCKDKDITFDENINENKVDKDNEKEIVEEDEILNQMKAMTLDEKIGQLIIAGFDGQSLNEEAIDYIENLKVGGFILFGRNIADENQTLELLNNLKEANSNNDIPLFLSIDEEGGRVSRLPHAFVKIPDAIKVGSKEDSSIAYELGNILGNRVKSLGLNMNFAPILDVNSNPNNPVIGDRAFGSEVETVVEKGIETMKGIRDTKVIPAVKHFPGHGDTSMDSHVNLPIVEKTIEELKSMELVPFIKAIEEDVDMIMVAHILYPEIDEELPATMSSNIIEELLRNELAYNGVVVSDDMTMGAIIENYSLEDAVLSFIKSGGDLALVCHGIENPGKVIEKLKEAVSSGDLLEEDIDEKVYRILKLKKRYELEDSIINEIDLKELNNRTKELVNRINK